MASATGTTAHGAGIAGDSATEPPRILLWFDYSCPLCYLDDYRFEELSGQFDVEVVLVPFELRETVGQAGESAAERGLTHSEHYVEHVMREAARRGIDMHLPDLVPNTHLALVLGEAGRDAGVQVHRRVHRAIFEAYFVRERDIGDRTVLTDIARDAGLDAALVQAAWGSERYEQRIHSFRHLAIAMGVDGTPAALICNEFMMGSRPLGVLRASVERCLGIAGAGGLDGVSPAAGVSDETADAGEVLATRGEPPPAPAEGPAGYGEAVQ